MMQMNTVDAVMRTLADPTRRAAMSITGPTPRGLAPLVDWMALHGVFWREHAYLMPEGARLPFRSQAPRFAFEQE